MSDPYWKIVEPVWDSISIYDGENVFLEQFEKATEKQKNLFSSHWAQSEILNGGLAQFFSNPTGVLAPEAVEAFRKLGMPKCAQAIEDAMSFFGDEYPRNRELREECLERFYEENKEIEIPLEKYEDLVADNIEEENGGFLDSANKYATQG
ncbi:MAG: hypothetical protein ACJAS9_003332 [Polaribacter sp.]|jgi:hypothetical protein